MPLTLEKLQELQSDAMADDVDIDLEKMSLWTEEQAVAYFESGGTVQPGAERPVVVYVPELEQTRTELTRAKAGRPGCVFKYICNL